MPSSKEISVKENGKVHSRPRVLLSKENGPSVETGETSFRVYYGATGAAVPFMWESQPGTPKHPMFNKSHDEHDNILPPLTPPPSYTLSSPLYKNSKKSRKPKIFDMIFSSMSRKNSHVSPTSSLSSPMSWSTSTSSSSSSSLSSPHVGGKKHKSHRRSLSLCSSGIKSPLFGDEDHASVTSPPFTKCFGFKKKQDCYSVQPYEGCRFTN